MSFETVVNKLLENRFGAGFVCENKKLTLTAYFGKYKRQWIFTLGKVTK
jgi:hypothetical protein